MFCVIVSRLKKEGEICGRCIGTFCMPGCKAAEDWGQDCGKCEKGLVCRLSLPGSSSCTKVSTGNCIFIIIRIGLKFVLPKKFQLSLM